MSLLERNKAKFCRTAFIISCSLAFSACKDHISGQSLDEIKGSLSQISKELAPVASGLTDQAALGASYVFNYEYKVITIPAADSDASLEAALNQLGAERWDCFSIMPTGNTVRITCKKIPYALARSLIGL